MGHDLGMKSKVHPKHQTECRVNNWAECDQTLVQRGDITLWIPEEELRWRTPSISANLGFMPHARLAFTGWCRVLLPRGSTSVSLRCRRIEVRL